MTRVISFRTIRIGCRRSKPRGLCLTEGKIEMVSLNVFIVRFYPDPGYRAADNVEEGRKPYTIRRVL